MNRQLLIHTLITIHCTFSLKLEGYIKQISKQIEAHLYDVEM